jgi:hypothetical protein
VGGNAVISGATPAELNGTFTVATVVSPTVFRIPIGAFAGPHPASPATGTILLNIGNVTDLVALAGVERVGAATDVEFVFTRPDGSEIRGAENARIALAEAINVPLTLSAILRGTATQSPTLFAGTQALYGDIQETADYVTRAIPCAAGARVSCTFEALLPGGSSVTVEFQKADNTWQTVTLTSSSAVGDGWVEQVYTVANFAAGGTTTRARLTLSGSAAARPQLRQLRLVVI